MRSRGIIILGVSLREKLGTSTKGLYSRSEACSRQRPEALELPLCVGILCTVPGVQINAELFVGLTYHTVLSSIRSPTQLLLRELFLLWEPFTGLPGRPDTFSNRRAHPRKNPVGRPWPVIPCRSHWPFKFWAGFSGKTLSGTAGGDCINCFVLPHTVLVRSTPSRNGPMSNH